MNIGALLGAMAEMGADPGVLTVLREFAQDHGAIDETAADDRRFLDGPIIVHNSAWMADIPQWMFAQARAERAEIVLGESKWLVGPTEIAAVMFPRTMEAPMPSAMADLYLWASTQAAARHFGRDLESLWSQVGGRRIEDREVLEPRGQLYYEYRNLASEIRRKVINAQKGREPKRDPARKSHPDERPDGAGFMQLSFYDQLAA